jgi:hypothetical protein
MHASCTYSLVIKLYIYFSFKCATLDVMPVTMIFRPVHSPMSRPLASFSLSFSFPAKPAFSLSFFSPCQDHWSKLSIEHMQQRSLPLDESAGTAWPLPGHPRAGLHKSSRSFTEPCRKSHRCRQLTNRPLPRAHLLRLRRQESRARSRENHAFRLAV